MSNPIAWMGFLISCSLLWISSITFSLQNPKDPHHHERQHEVPTEEGSLTLPSSEDQYLISLDIPNWNPWLACECYYSACRDQSIYSTPSGLPGNNSQIAGIPQGNGFGLAQEPHNLNKALTSPYCLHTPLSTPNRNLSLFWSLGWIEDLLAISNHGLHAWKSLLQHGARNPHISNALGCQARAALDNPSSATLRSFWKTHLLTCH